MLYKGSWKIVQNQAYSYYTSNNLKVHKREKFFVSDFEFFTIL